MLVYSQKIHFCGNTLFRPFPPKKRNLSNSHKTQDTLRCQCSLLFYDLIFAPPTPLFSYASVVLERTRSIEFPQSNILFALCNQRSSGLEISSRSYDIICICSPFLFFSSGAPIDPIEFPVMSLYNQMSYPYCVTREVPDVSFRRNPTISHSFFPNPVCSLRGR